MLLKQRDISILVIEQECNQLWLLISITLHAFKYEREEDFADGK